MLSRLCLTRIQSQRCSSPRRAQTGLNVSGLSRLATESVDRSPSDIVSFEKLTEGGFNRTFLIIMHDDFQLVVRIPYPVTVPKFYTVAGEVSTMDAFVRLGSLFPTILTYIGQRSGNGVHLYGVCRRCEVERHLV